MVKLIQMAFNLSKDARDFVLKSKDFKVPAIVLFERTYSSWCGPEVYRGVQILEKEELQKYKELTNVSDKNVEFDIFVEEHLLTKLNGKAEIKLTGFGPFRRLALA